MKDFMLNTLGPLAMFGLFAYLIGISVDYYLSDYLQSYVS